MEKDVSTVVPTGNLLRKLHLFTGIIATVYTAMVVCSFAWLLHYEHRKQISLAQREAQATFNQEISFRSWATKHGGVYVPATVETPPNPYLNQTPERDIVTPSGKQLTLMNPAYVVRQVMQEYEKQHGVKGKLTSLKTLNPANAPDPWERQALDRLALGEQEVVAISEMAGKPFLRLMKPLITSEGCLKCHAAQGYKVGDVRGGMDIAVPLASYLANEKEAQQNLTVSHLIIWLLGMMGIGFGYSKGKAGLIGRQQMEEELRNSEGKLRTLVQAIPDLIWLKDANGRYLACNKMFERFFGVGEATIIGKTDFDFVDRDLADLFRENDRKAMAAGKPSCNEEWITFADDGRQALLETTKVPMFDDQGTLIGVMGIGHDITERKQFEEELLKLSSAIEQSPVSIVITDVKGNIEFVNPKFSQLTGYSAAEAIGKNPRILKSADTPPELYRQLWTDITAGKVWHGEFCNKKKNGDSFLEYATIAPVKNREGEISSFIAIKEDITERRSLESQLRQSQKMEAIGTLTGGIAHDFNNILSVIIGFSSIIEMKLAKDDPLRDHVMQILTAADRAANLTRSMLAFSRKQSMEVRPVQMNEIIIGMEKMLRRLIREDIELRINLTEEALPVMADIGQIEQVLLNLITNAKDSMPSGGGITVTTEKAVLDESFIKSHGFGEQGRYALIIFADSGEGIEERVRQRLFEPFFTTKEVGKGTGLGLAVCYGIIKQHRGYIICSSEPGKGTTFRVYLPLKQTSADDASTVNGESVSPRGGIETILVAEDEATVRNLTTSILKEFGYSVIEANDGAEAVAKFNESRGEIQLCLFDMIMPKRNGRDAWEEIRKSRPDIKVLFMSGYQPDAYHAGMNLITKPVLPRELLKRVREVLDSTG